ncbi:MAG TPA: hypothetical protein VJZ71_20030 [Phycisphaerae bacterium]|nr:hypothetical protein [Phycisphaerae bacterium]
MFATQESDTFGYLGANPADIGDGELFEEATVACSGRLQRPAERLIGDQGEFVTKTTNGRGCGPTSIVVGLAFSTFIEGGLQQADDWVFADEHVVIQGRRFLPNTAIRWRLKARLAGCGNTFLCFGLVEFGEKGILVGGGLAGAGLCAPFRHHGFFQEIEVMEYDVSVEEFGKHDKDDQSSSWLLISGFPNEATLIPRSAK